MRLNRVNTFGTPEKLCIRCALCHTLRQLYSEHYYPCGSWPWHCHRYDRTIAISPAYYTPDSKIHVANMGPTWVLSAPDGPHVGPMDLAIRDVQQNSSQMVNKTIRQCFIPTWFCSYHCCFEAYKCSRQVHTLQHPWMDEAWTLIKYCLRFPISILYGQ